MIIKLIIAVDKNGVMGKDNSLPWKLSDDLKMFKKITNNKPLIMGSKTLKSLPGILPNREHIVLSNSLYGTEDYSVFTSIKNAIDYLEDDNNEEVFIIGGANIIKQFTEQKLFDELIITHVDTSVDGDTVIDLDNDLKLHEWDIYNSMFFDKNDKNEHAFRINKYIYKKKRFY